MHHAAEYLIVNTGCFTSHLEKLFLKNWSKTFKYNLLNFQAASFNVTQVIQQSTWNSFVPACLYVTWYHTVHQELDIVRDNLQ